MTKTPTKLQAETIIEGFRDVTEIATTGFDAFYKEADIKGSTAASSGDGSKAASSGYYSTAASSGDGSKAASSGNYSKAASSGNYSKAASSGYCSTAASSGNYSKAASSGDYSTAASSGDGSKAASSGNGSKAASSGYGSKAASLGDNSTAASSGYCSTAASSGNHSACSALGYRAAVKGSMGNLLMASEYVKNDGTLCPVGGKADIVDGKELKPDRWYIVEKSKWVEVDLTDGIFSYVLSSKSGVKKVKTDDGKILYVVGDENGNYAHGKTIKEARKDLVFKSVAKFDGNIPESAAGKEWVGIYRSVTGACAAGVKDFVDETKADLDKTYTVQQILHMVSGRYGAEKLVALLDKSKQPSIRA